MKKLLSAFVFVATLVSATAVHAAPIKYSSLLERQLFQQVATTNLSLRELVVNPAKITVGTNVLTLVEFPDDITQVASARPDFLNSQISEVNKAQLLLSAKKSSGQTDLHVTLASGETAMFTVVIDARRSSPTRYVVKNADAPTPTTAPVNTGASPADWLGVRADFSTYDNGDVVVNYALQNRSTDASIFAGNTNLLFYTTIEGKKQPLEYKITRDSQNGGTLNPGKAEYGVIRVFNPASPLTTLTMEWQIVNQKNRQRVTYKVEFDLANGRSL
jgi:hypothetical protein